jgi:hypothetical protein
VYGVPSKGVWWRLCSVPISAGGHFSTELPSRSLPLGSRAARAEANRVNANGGTLHDDATVITRATHCGKIGVGRPVACWSSQAFLHIGWDWFGVSNSETQFGRRMRANGLRMASMESSQVCIRATVGLRPTDSTGSATSRAASDAPAASDAEGAPATTDAQADSGVVEWLQGKTRVRYGCARWAQRTGGMSGPSLHCGELNCCRVFDEPVRLHRPHASPALQRA